MSINSLLKHTYINIKSIFYSINNLLIIMFISLTTSLLAVVFFPLVFSYSLIVSVSVTSICIVAFTKTYIEYNSPLIKNMDNITSSKLQSYVVSYLCILILSMFTFILSFSLLIILNQFNLLLVDWFKYTNGNDGDNKYVFNIQLFIISIYCTFLISTITFLLSIIAYGITNDKKTYHMIMFSIIILILIFGGSINNYWWPTGDASLFNSNRHGGLYRMSDSPFPWEIYWASAIFPYFSMGSLLNVSMALSRCELLVVDGVEASINILDNGSTTYFNIDPLTGLRYHSSMFELFSFDNDWLWVFMLVTPIIEIILLTLIFLPIYNMNNK